jgi:hypothetical protein
MDSVFPVLTEREVSAEQVIALGQEEYFPIVVARVLFADGQFGSYTRFRFSEKERELIARGADLILGQPHLLSRRASLHAEGSVYDPTQSIPEDGPHRQKVRSVDRSEFLRHLLWKGSYVDVPMPLWVQRYLPCDAVQVVKGPINIVRRFGYP